MPRPLYPGDDRDFDCTTALEADLFARGILRKGHHFYSEDISDAEEWEAGDELLSLGEEDDYREVA